jgi:Recombinase
VKQSMRDAITGEVTLDHLARRFAEGWKISSIEWFREAEASAVPAESTHILNNHAALPYGLQVSESGVVQENPLEATVLLLILEQIIREKRIQEIATELNQHGFSTRDGMPWGPTDVFNLLPRLIEAGPSLLKSAAWQQRRPATQPKAN